jgi:hypothetical protein
MRSASDEMLSLRHFKSIFLEKKLTWNFEEKNDFIALEKNQT